MQTLQDALAGKLILNYGSGNICTFYWFGKLSARSRLWLLYTYCRCIYASPSLFPLILHCLSKSFHFGARLAFCASFQFTARDTIVDSRFDCCENRQFRCHRSGRPIARLPIFRTNFFFLSRLPLTNLRPPSVCACVSGGRKNSALREGIVLYAQTISQIFLLSPGEIEFRARIRVQARGHRFLSPCVCLSLQ